MLDRYTCIDYSEKILCCDLPFKQYGFYYRVRHTKYEDRLANNANPDQTAPNAPDLGLQSDQRLPCSLPR